MAKQKKPNPFMDMEGEEEPTSNKPHVDIEQDLTNKIPSTLSSSLLSLPMTIKKFHSRAGFEKSVPFIQKYLSDRKATSRKLTMLDTVWRLAKEKAHVEVKKADQEDDDEAVTCVKAVACVNPVTCVNAVTCVKEVACVKACIRNHPCPDGHAEGSTCPTCKVKVSHRFSCKHEVQFLCHEKPINIKCNQLCERECDMKHFCLPHSCNTDCPKCDIDILTTHADCGHSELVPCHVKCADQNRKCHAKVNSTASVCGHVVAVPCFMANNMTPEEVLRFCKIPCEMEFEKNKSYCGHFCPSTCGQCSYMRIHGKCEETCGRSLICGHICNVPCSTSCPPCGLQCETVCDHGSCPNICGQECVDCQEPCTWKCPHKKCTKKCHEECDREPCNEPCPRLLECGHACIGFCGEICPPLCRVCSREELCKNENMSLGEYTDTDRFVYLPECHHVVEDEFLGLWMKTKPSDGEIVWKGCPICKSIIFRCHRYGKLIRENHKLIGQIKRVVFGDEESINKTLRQCVALLPVKPPAFLAFHEFIQKQFALPDQKWTLENLIAKKFDKVAAYRLEFLCKLWSNSANQAKQWKSIHKPNNIERLKTLHQGLFKKIVHLAQSGRPFQMNEFRDIELEVARLHNYSELYSRLGKHQPVDVQKLAALPVAVEAFTAAERFLRLAIRFDSHIEKSFKEALTVLDRRLKYTLKITESDRRSIVAAIGATVGRWFKCENGHVYLVTECGGATQKSVCSECGAEIGGLQHRLLESNNLATEMDGAVEPLYPNAVPNQLGPLAND